MIYLDSFRFPNDDQEEDFFFSVNGLVPNDIYPWRFLSKQDFFSLDCANITILYGGNGCGKSTVLNTIAQKIGLRRHTPYNRGYYYYDDFISMCSYRTDPLFLGDLADITTMITSDEIFDSILNTRKSNLQHELRSNALSEFYDDVPDQRSIDCNNPDSIAAYGRSVNARTNYRRTFIHGELGSKRKSYSNGETGYLRIVNQITEGLYLLDEPENSLSARWQSKLAEFIRLSAKSCNCQFIIATHSPFLLAMEGAKIYNMEGDYVTLSAWHELESSKLYYELFRQLDGKL